MTDIRELIDDLLEVEKIIAGQPDWNPTDRDGQFRWGGILEVGGDSTRMKIAFDAYPNEARRRIIATMSLGRCFWRAEFAEFASHMNQPPVPDGFVKGLVIGPHYHCWADNRRFATQDQIGELHLARLAPSNIHGVENVIRWFCGQVNVSVNFEVPEYPRRTKLL